MSLKFATITFDIRNYALLPQAEQIVVDVEDAEIIGTQKLRVYNSATDEFDDTEQVYVRVEENIYAKAGATITQWQGWLNQIEQEPAVPEAVELTLSSGGYYTQLAGTLIEQIIVKPTVGTPVVRLGTAAGLDDIMFDSPTTGGSVVFSLDRFRETAGRIYFGFAGGSTVMVYILMRKVI